MKPLVCIHGFLGNQTDFSAFTFEGYKTHTYEIPGHGQNQRALAQYNLEALALDFENYLRELPNPLVWGYSLGGRILQKVLERSQVNLSGAILESTGFVQDPVERVQNDRLWAHKITSLEVKAFLEEWYSQDLFKSLRNSPNYLKTLELRTQYQSDIAAQILLDASPALNPLPNPLKITVPCLVLVGKLDLKYSKMWAPLIDKNPNLDIRTLENVGHALHLESPDEVFKIVQTWLKKI